MCTKRNAGVTGFTPLTTSCAHSRTNAVIAPRPDNVRVGNRDLWQPSTRSVVECPTWPSPPKADHVKRDSVVFSPLPPKRIVNYTQPKNTIPQ